MLSRHRNMIRNPSTVIRAALLCSALWLGVCSAALAAGTPPVQLSPNAPERYTVVRGDTLWGIAGRFLSAPWQWPQVWQLNREQIANPHLIYPGDVVILDRSGTVPRLRLARDPSASGLGDTAGLPLVRLQPGARSQPLAAQALPLLPAAAIEPFLNRPWVLDPAELAQHARIVGTQDGRIYLSRGDLAYARGLPGDAPEQWHVYRPARALLDPTTRQPLAWETLFVGTARLMRAGDPATLRIESNQEEIGEGDRLIPAAPSVLPSLAPRSPERALEGRILSVYRGVESVGRHSVVALSLGSSAGLEVGHVLRVLSVGRQITDRTTREPVLLPQEPIGELVVFRVFDRIAYGLVTGASQAISVGATVASPSLQATGSPRSASASASVPVPAAMPVPASTTTASSVSAAR